MMGGYHMMSGMGAGMILVVVFWIVVTALILWGIIDMARIQQKLSEPAPQEILKQRYARGEISPEEFELASKVLSNTTRLPEHQY